MTKQKIEVIVSIMNERLLSWRVSPEYLGADFSSNHKSDWDLLVRAYSQRPADCIDSRVRDLRDGLDRMFRELVDFGDPTVWNDSQVSVPEKALITRLGVDEATPLGDNYLYIFSRHTARDYLSHELYVSADDDFEPEPIIEAAKVPERNPNYNRPDKIAGVWLDLEEAIRTESHSVYDVAQLEDANQTMKHLFDMVGLKLPRGIQALYDAAPIYRQHG